MFKIIFKRYLKGAVALFLKLLSHFPSQHFRTWCLKYFFRMKISSNVVLYSGFQVRKPRGISIGKGTVVGYNCELDGRRGLTIGSNVNISSDVMIYTLQHDYNSVDFRQSGGSVEIGDYCWISARSIILPGVKIGEGAVVAAGAVVTKDVSPYTVVGGIPAKQIATRNINLKYCPAEHSLAFV